jgi:hypothetical protein
MKTEHPIRPLCAALEVSASGYYDWHHRQTHPSRRTRENAQLVQHIVQFHAASRQTYGSPRIQAALARAGHVYGRHRIAWSTTIIPLSGDDYYLPVAWG